MTPRIWRPHPANDSNGFTLLELLAAAAAGVLVALAAGEAMVSHVKSSARAEALQRQREDWSRATRFIESEIAMSELVYTNAADVQIPSSCGLNANEFRMALDLGLGSDRPKVIYGVKNVRDLPASEQRFWRLDPENKQSYNVLIRCGPSIGQALEEDGSDDYLSGDPQRSILVDGLDPNATPTGSGGFCTIDTTATPSKCLPNLANSQANKSKSASFILALKGVVSTYSFGAGSYSRINPTNTFPDTLSNCDRACDSNGNCSDVGATFLLKGRYLQADTLSIPIGAITDNDSTMICGLGGDSGGGDFIAGTQVNDVIDAGAYSANCPPGVGPGAVIDGGSDGLNHLLGTPCDDTMIGGAGDDIIIGRGGGDLIIDGDGQNRYFPWVEDKNLNRNAKIQGGAGTDVLFLRFNKSDFTISCPTDLPELRGSSVISDGTRSITTTNVEKVVFKNSDQSDLC